MRDRGNPPTARVQQQELAGIIQQALDSLNERQRAFVEGAPAQSIFAAQPWREQADGRESVCWDEQPQRCGQGRCEDHGCDFSRRGGHGDRLATQLGVEVVVEFGERTREDRRRGRRARGRTTSPPRGRCCRWRGRGSSCGIARCRPAPGCTEGGPEWKKRRRGGSPPHARAWNDSNVIPSVSRDLVARAARHPPPRSLDSRSG